MQFRMISHLARTWIAALYLLAIPSVDPQMMYPMFPPPVQIAVPMPVPVPIMVQDTTPSTTTTTPKPRDSPENGMGFVPMPMPMPMPMAVPFAFPAFPAIACQGKGNKRPKNCPPCPPCVCRPACTPKFFSYCSPCHQKCRCRSKEDTPTPIPPPKPAEMGPSYGVAVPVPAPMFAPPPPPVVVIPFPPPRPPRGRRPSYSDSSSDCTNTETESIEDCSSSTSYERGWKRRKKIGHAKRRPGYRRRFVSIEDRDNELVKPVLTYLSRNGDIKLKRRLTNEEAAELMNDKPYQKIRVMAGEDESNMPRVSITSNTETDSGRARSSHRRRQVVLSEGVAQHMLGEGKKELVFRPPGGKKISNLTVSFQISE